MKKNMALSDACGREGGDYYGTEKAADTTPEKQGDLCTAKIKVYSFKSSRTKTHNA